MMSQCEHCVCTSVYWTIWQKKPKFCVWEIWSCTVIEMCHLCLFNYWQDTLLLLLKCQVYCWHCKSALILSFSVRMYVCSFLPDLQGKWFGWVQWNLVGRSVIGSSLLHKIDLQPQRCLCLATKKNWDNMPNLKTKRGWISSGTC